MMVCQRGDKNCGSLFNLMSFTAGNVAFVIRKEKPTTTRMHCCQLGLGDDSLSHVYCHFYRVHTENQTLCCSKNKDKIPI